MKMAVFARRVAMSSALFLMLLVSYGCPIGWKVCQTGQECDARQRCLENRCQVPPEEDNRPPIARAGSDQRVKKGVRIRVDGGKSSDVDLDRLTFTWSFKSRPTGSRAVFDNARSPQASFVPDLAGEYVIKLTVVDALGLKDEDFLTVRVNHPPEASAGGDKLVLPNANVNLNAGRSRDLDEDPLTYEWVLVERPAGSNSKLSSNQAVSSSFVVDKPGVYVAEVTVSDGMDTDKDRVIVRVADPDQVVPVLKKLDPWKAPKRSIVLVNVLGDGFIQGAEVLFDDTPITTTYLSKDRLQARLNLKDVKIGAHQIKVKNPKGKTTEGVLFQVSEVPVPEIQSVSPDSVTAGTVLKATIVGSGFVADAKVLFQGKVVPTVYKDQSKLEVTIQTTGIKAGTYDLIVENERNKRSRPYGIRVSAIPPTPSISLVQPDPRVYEVNRVYTKLTIYARGLTSETQVWINNKRYRGQIVRNIGSSTGTLELPNFSTMGMEAGRISFQLKNISPGKTFTSTPYNLSFIDPNVLNIYSVRFYLKGRSSIAATNQKYDYVEIRGRNFNKDLRVFVDGKRYTTKVRYLSKSTIRLEGFSTSGWSAGKHSFRVDQTVEAKVYKSNTYSLTFADGRIPQLSSVTTSNGPFYTERNFTFALIRGYFFAKGAEVLIDGQPYKGASHLENDNAIYLYQFSTKGWQPGLHTFLVQQTIGGKTYKSRLYQLNIQDGRTPRLSRLIIRPSSVMYIGGTYEIQITGTNILPGAVLLIDGATYTKPAQITQNLVTIPGFETKGLQQRRYSIQVRNTINGQIFTSNGLSIYPRKRPAPRLYSVTPSVINASQTAAALVVNGAYLSTDSRLLLNGSEVKATFTSSQARLTLDAKTLGSGRYSLEVENRDGQKSNKITLEIVPDLSPILWEVYPSDLFLYAKPVFSRTVRLRLGGFLLEPNSLVLYNGKVIGKLSRVNGNYGEVDIPTGIFTTSGPALIQVKNANGKTSNTTQLWIHRDSKPLIYQVSPDQLYTTTSPMTIRVYGRGFTNKSQIVFNGKAVISAFTPYLSTSVAKVPYTGTLTAVLQPGELAQAPDITTVKVRNDDGSESAPFTIVRYTTSGGTMRLYGTPTSLFEGQSTPLTYSIRGSRFTKTSKVYLNGTALTTLYSSSSRLTITFTVPKTFKAGQLVSWQVKDGNNVSQMRMAIVERAPRINSILTPVLRKSDPAPVLKMTVSYVNPGCTLELFNTSYPVINSGTIQILVLNEISKAKAGVHTLVLKEPQGRQSQTGAIHVIP